MTVTCGEGSVPRQLAAEKLQLAEAKRRRFRALYHVHFTHYVVLVDRDPEFGFHLARANFGPFLVRTRIS